MKKSKVFRGAFILLVLAHCFSVAHAVCMDPITWVSGYKEPLASEVRKAEAIVIGRVISEQPLQDDPQDPDGVTAYDVTVRVLVRLKGNLPDTFVIKNENTSSRYPMGIGEEHILFVSRTGNELWVNSCGNSALRAKAPRLSKNIYKQLQKRSPSASH